MSIAYSFSKTDRNGGSGDRNSPSPDAYNPENAIRAVKEVSPEWSFPRSSNQGPRDMNPGPGQYDADLTKLKMNVSYSIGSKPVVDFYSPVRTNKAPGPGSYDPVLLNKPPTYTMGAKRNNLSNLNTPGPGQYDVNLSMSQRPGTSPFISNSRRETTPLKDGSRSQMVGSPGPGAYSPNHEIVKYKNPTAKITQGRKGITSRDLSPGPGAYDGVSKEIGKNTPAISFKGRPQTAKLSETPGPGSYQYDHKTISQTTKSQRGGGVSSMKNKSQRLSHMPRDQIYSPGPGAYDANVNAIKDRVRNATAAFGKSQRTGFVGREEQLKPGPGNYEIPDTRNNKAYKMGQKLSMLLKDTTPGPGHYEPSHTLSKERIQSATIKDGQTKSGFFSTIQSPGPGHYDDAKQFGKDVKSFTIQSRKEEKLDTLSPGPGTYDGSLHVVKDTIRTFKMGTSQRLDVTSKSARELPGPGQYSSNKQFGADAVTFSMRGKVQEKQREDIPGPGSYNALDAINRDKSPSFRMGTSQRQTVVHKEKASLPGPGNYDQQSHIGQSGPKFTFSTKLQPKVKDNNPGPGNYEASTHIVKDRVISHKISQSQRMDIVTKEMLYQPGPGEYDSPKRFGDGAPSVSIRGRPQDNLRNDSPGPGHYDADHKTVKDSVVTYKMSASKRGDLVSKTARDLPGPGNYEHDTAIGKSFAYTMGGKSKEVQDNSKPGPGHYDPKLYLTKDQTGQTFKMSQSTRVDIVSKEMVSKPGPGQYSHGEEFGKEAKSFQIRGRPQDKVGNENPGPGNYEAVHSAVKDTVVTYKIGSSQRQQLVSREAMNSPGPGHYDSPSRGTGPNYTMCGRSSSREIMDVPGPGHYEANESMTKYKSPSYKITHGSQRISVVSKEQMTMPGPGNYSHQREFGQDAKTFSMRGRPQDKVGNEVPGPGNYDGNIEVVKDKVRSYKMGSGQNRSMIVSKEANFLPGPGHYDSPSRQTGPTYTMGGRTDSPPKHDIPGPGQYDPSESVIKYTAPSFKMDNATQRTNFVSKEHQLSPGPGNYADPREFGKDAKSFQIRGKGQELTRNENPGPGNYDPAESVTKYQSPTYKIDGGTKRSNLVSSEKLSMPGPGNYEQHSHIGKGPAPSIRGRPDPQRDDNLPGPGTYDANIDTVKDKSQNSFRIGTHKRDFLSMSSQDLSKPGPGFYDVKDSNRGPAYSIKGRQSERHDNSKPGPGHYDAIDSAVKHQNPAHDFSRSPDRSRSGSPHKDGLPGPGQYDNRDYNLAGHQSIAYTIPKGEKKDEFSDTPGPGHYKIPVKFADVPSYNHTVQSDEFKWV